MRTSRGALYLTAGALVGQVCAVSARAESPTPPMPHRFLFTSLGWITSRAGDDYYPAEISDELVEDWRNYAAYLKEVGFTSIGPWGFLCNAFPYPLRVDVPGGDGGPPRVSARKAAQTRRIVEACRQQGISFYYGMCLYFAYWPEYIAASPQAAPDKPSALCPLYQGDPGRGIPGSIDWMKQAIDFVMATSPVDGFAFESFHHGRCRCTRCLERFPDTPRGTAEFHWMANGPVFEHVRQKHPQLKILFCPEGPLEIIQRSENLDILEKTLRACDYFVWCGAVHPPEVMNRLAAACPNVGFMFRQEPWQSVPPAQSPRDGWFFPNLVNPLGRTIHDRARTFRWAGVAGCGLGKDNPCDNVSLRFLARMQLHPGRDPEQAACEILREIYRPADDETLRKLYAVFEESERRFRELWPTWFMHIDFMPKGFKFSAGQAVEMVNTYQIALARLRGIQPKLGNVDQARRLEGSIVQWLGYIKEQLKKDYGYEMP